MKKRVFSGITPSNVITIGNYIGAVKRWTHLQNDETLENIYCVVDLHTLTVKQDPDKLRERTYDLFALFLAVGLDPNKSILFLQGHVSAHAEGAWLLTPADDAHVFEGKADWSKLTTWLSLGKAIDIERTNRGTA